MPTKADLSPKEAIAAFEALRASLGSKAGVYVSLNMIDMLNKGHGYYASISPKGITERTTLYVSADTLRDLLAAAYEAVEGHRELHEANTIRAMALEIITVTADLGECTDAALRAKFDASEVKRFGIAACERANLMSANRPFSIVRTSGSNVEAA